MVLRTVQTLTIVPLRRPGNRSGTPVWFGLAASAMMACLGCQAGGPERIISWELAQPVDLGTVPQWHARITAEETVPVELTERLCDEFDFVRIRSAAEWDRLARSVTLEGGMPHRRPDFSHGCVVGIIARIGQPAGDAWPLRLEEVRATDRIGWVRFRLSAGLYYPISSSAYFVAAYVPGLREARMVQVNKRIFAITDSPPAAWRTRSDAPPTGTTPATERETPPNAPSASRGRT